MLRVAACCLVVVCASGGAAVAVPPGGPTGPSAPAEYDPASADPVTSRPLYYRRALRTQDMDGRSLRELALMRNWIFARAGNRFRKPWLHNFFSPLAWYRPQPRQDTSVLTGYDRNNAAKLAQVEASLTTAQLKAMRQPVLDALRKDPGYPNAPAQPHQVTELRLISARLGQWVEPKPGQAGSPLEDPSRLDFVLSLADLDQMSRRDLRLLRNLVYARRGRPFRSDILARYFSAMEWYRPDERYTDRRLTGVDRKNIKLIRSVEDQVGGPLTEQAHQKSDTGFLGEA